MFKVGDKVVRKVAELSSGSGSWTRNKVYTVIGVRPERVLASMNTQIADDRGYTAWWDNRRFDLYVEPVVEGVKRLRVIEGLGVLRVGTIVSVRNESATSYLLEEHPGKRYRKNRFEELERANASTEVRAITPKEEPVKADYKAGEAVYIVSQPKDGVLGDYYKSTVVNPSETAGQRATRLAKDKEKLFIVGSSFPYKAHGNSYFMLSDEPNGAYVLAATPEMIRPYPVARELKVGDRVIAVDIERAYHEQNPWGHVNLNITKAEPMEVLSFVTHSTGVPGFRAERHKGYWIGNYPIDAFTFEDGSPIKGGAPFGKEKEREPLPDIIKALKFEGNPSGTCGYSILFKDATKWTPYLNVGCYGSMNSLFVKATERLGITVHHLQRGNYKLKPGNEEHALRWYDYLMFRSPWADCFIKSDDIPDAATAMKVGFEINTNKSISQVLGAVIAARDAWEHQSRLKVFSHFVDEGFTEHTAYIMAFVLNEADGKFTISAMSDSHTNMSGALEAEGYFKFFREGYHLPNILKEPALNSGPCGGYLVSGAIAKWDSNLPNTLYKFVLENVKKELVGEGFYQKAYVTLEAANELAAIIDKEFTK